MKRKRKNLWRQGWFLKLSGIGCAHFVQHHYHWIQLDQEKKSPFAIQWQEGNWCQDIGKLSRMPTHSSTCKIRVNEHFGKKTEFWRWFICGQNRCSSSVVFNQPASNFTVKRFSKRNMYWERNREAKEVKMMIPANIAKCVSFLCFGYSFQNEQFQCENN